MSRCFKGDVLIITRLPCGKMIKKAKRDSEKYISMHMKVCESCRDSENVNVALPNVVGVDNTVVLMNRAFNEYTRERHMLH